MLLLNYKPVLSQPTGIGTYAQQVLPALQKFEHIFLPGGGSGGIKQRISRLLWTQYQLPMLASMRRVDLIFTPAPEGYLGAQKIRQVVMVHDLRPLVYPQKDFQSIYFKSWVPPLLRSCHHILTNSRHTASEILKIKGINPSKITITFLGYDSSHFSVSTQESYKKSGPRYLLHVGQQYPHKNISNIISSFSRIASQDKTLQLWLAGKSTPRETPRLKSMVKELGLEDRILFINYVPYSQLPSLYQNALIFLYPSIQEGFGLPILESMACGTPVITSFGSATEEVAGDAALLVNPLSIDELTEAISCLLRADEERNRLSSAGLQHVNQYQWSSTRASLSSCLQNLL